MSLTQAQAKKIAAAALAETRFGDLRVQVEATRTGNARFAASGPTTSADVDAVEVSVTAGKPDGRHATAKGNRTDSIGLAALVQRAEAMAELAPVDPEWMPALAKQVYDRVDAFDGAASRMDATARTSRVRAAILAGGTDGLDVSGYLQHEDKATYVANRSGLAGYFRATEVSLSCTCRTPDGTGSGRGSYVSHALSGLDSALIAREAAAWSLRSRAPAAVDPGKYTVVLAPQAVAELLSFLVGELSHRAAVEGRSFFSGEAGTTRIGETLFGKNISLRSDPARRTAPASPFSRDGQPQRATDWVVGGKLLALTANRFWADKNGVPVRPKPSSIHFEGGTSSLDDLIAGVDRGILVSRFWYNRMLSPRGIVATGLTRDGTFLIEKGKISKPVKNLRYNDSPVTLLTRATALGVAVRVADMERVTVVPAAVVEGFNFESTSDAV